MFQEKQISILDTSYFFYLLTRNSKLLNFYLSDKEIHYKLFIDENNCLIKNNPELSVNKSYLLDSNNIVINSAKHICNL